MFDPLTPKALAATRKPGADIARKRPIVPVPNDAPPMQFRHPEHGEATKVWPYHDTDRNLLGFVCRWDLDGEDGKRKKVILPVTFCDLGDGRRAWRSAGFPTPRPLFRLPDILANPDALIIVTEGEKASDAATRLFSDAVATTPPHGAKSPQKADWKPLHDRRVVIWPDNDEAGIEYASAVQRLASQAGATEVRIVQVPADFPAQWDLADPIPDGWTEERLGELLDAAPVATCETARQASAVTQHPLRSKPQPLPKGLPAVPPFLPELLPSAFRAWVMDIAERMQCPPDYPAVAAMVAASALIGRQVAIRPKRRDDWTVIPNLWGAIVGRPGVLKTPALTEALRPVTALEVQAAQHHSEAVDEWEASGVVAKEAEKVTREGIRRALKKGDSDGAHALARSEIEPLDLPTRSRYLVNDTTVEALGVILKANPRGVLVFRDELTGFLRNLDREGHEAARAFYLEAWNGGGRFTYDRIGRGTIDIDACCVSILGGIQPGPLSEYLNGAVRSGSADDGLIQRFQLMVWPDPPTDWRNVDRWPDSSAKRQALEVFRRLDRLDTAALGAESGGDGAPFLRFAPDAQIAFDEWRADLERHLRTADEHPAVEAHLAKYRSLVPSLALICHVIENGAGPVSEAAVLRAAAWAEYLEGHARRLYQSVTHADTESARRLAKRLLSGDLTAPFTLRDVYRMGWSGLSIRASAQAAVDVLCDLDWLAPDTRETGGRSKTIFHLDPQVPEVTDALD